MPPTLREGRRLAIVTACSPAAADAQNAASWRRQVMMRWPHAQRHCPQSVKPSCSQPSSAVRTSCSSLWMCRPRWPVATLHSSTRSPRPSCAPPLLHRSRATARCPTTASALGTCSRLPSRRRRTRHHAAPPEFPSCCLLCSFRGLTIRSGSMASSSYSSILPRSSSASSSSLARPSRCLATCDATTSTRRSTGYVPRSPPSPLTSNRSPILRASKGRQATQRRPRSWLLPMRRPSTCSGLSMKRSSATGAPAGAPAATVAAAQRPGRARQHVQRAR